MSVYGIGAGYLAWQATEKIQKNTAGTDFADMIANKETKKAGIYAGSEKSASKKDVEHVTEEYKKKHPDQATHVDSQIRAGKKVLEKNGVENVSREDMTMEEYKAYFNEKMNSLYTHPSQRNRNDIIDITDAAYKRMQTDPEYEKKILDALAKNKAVNFGNYIPQISYMHIDDTWEGCYGYTQGMKENVGYTGGSSAKVRNDAGSRKKARQKELLIEYLEKRAQVKKQQQEMLNEKIAKQEQERSRFLQSWNNESRMSQVSAAYEANVMTDFAEGSNYVG